MRKIMVFASCLLILLGGCAKKEIPSSPSPLLKYSGNYEATAQISYKDLQAAATIVQSTPDSYEMIFTEPATIQDMVFSFQNDVLTVHYQGLSFQTNIQSIPISSPANVLMHTINTAFRDSDCTWVDTEDGNALSGTTVSGSFLLYIDPDQQLPQKLLVPDQDLEIEFVSFTALDETNNTST